MSRTTKVVQQIAANTEQIVEGLDKAIESAKRLGDERDEAVALLRRARLYFETLQWRDGLCVSGCGGRPYSGHTGYCGFSSLLAGIDVYLGEREAVDAKPGADG